jgi:hypothetical protein
MLVKYSVGFYNVNFLLNNNEIERNFLFKYLRYSEDNFFIDYEYNQMNWKNIINLSY